jgi:glycine dehydrogenase subunit 1
MLQAIYEYQTLICALTGMDLSNASMYDAATGLAEAALMAISITGRHEVVVLDTVNPHYRQVVAAYMRSTGYRLREVSVSPILGDSGGAAGLASATGPETACVIGQHPNFYGNLEDPPGLVASAHDVGALAILSVDPISLGLLKPPAEYGVDIVVGEGQALGNPMAFGGPLLGFFACKERFVRSFPGRIVGATVDQQGRRGYTMTLRTREQDIRRERATSNICTNQALLALCATIYLCELGRWGLRHVADLCLQKAHYAADRLQTIDGVRIAFPNRAFFKEFVVRLPADPERVCERLLQRGIVGGLPLGAYEPALQDGLLICVTETRTREDIDRFVAAMEESLKETR